MIVFELLLVLAFLVLPAVAICTQVIPARMHDIRFTGTNPDHAFEVIAHFIQGTCEQRFGYPSGYFFLTDKGTSRPSRILAKELQPAGSVTDGCSAQLAAMGMSGYQEGCLAGMMMMIVIGIIGAPFFAVSFLDRFFRRVLRSRIDVRITAKGADAVAHFAFYGPGGWSLRNRFARAFAPASIPEAVLPAGSSASVGIDTEQAA